MAYVFLSHSHDDKPLARRLAADLRISGHSIWLDEAEINIGDSLIQKIRDGIDQVDFVIAIISSSSIESEWVKNEIDLASNREINEKRIIVLPLLVSDVDLPGFLKGKFFGDFRNLENYDDSFLLLLRSLGPSNPIELPNPDELDALRKELAKAQDIARRHEIAATRASDVAFRAKSPKLRAAIESSEISHPQHAPINRTYAFQIEGTIVTLDYLLWAISKSKRHGAHPLEALLTIYDKWPDAASMIDAYSDMLNSNH
ncbi:MAG: toll/interleukin-1 receptor domain-containing protein [Caulobacteraceae bacterium]|nr:toll/interleukin-1 receptor domain-containing protein [Caulobacteraceae bacterium]